MEEVHITPQEDLPRILVRAECTQIQQKPDFLSDKEISLLLAAD